MFTEFIAIFFKNGTIRDDFGLEKAKETMLNEFPYDTYKKEFTKHARDFIYDANISAYERVKDE